ncbi:hypothetical protein BDR26DRAFT_918402 [Obelidium mucronatum]|nr:hypothetical protein BDR26DRAFT_918402 [Obelidium mucronatum]
MDRKSVVEISKAAAPPQKPNQIAPTVTQPAATTASLAAPHNLGPILSTENIDNSSLFLDAKLETPPMARPISAASTSPRASLKMRPISANAYHKQVKLSGFEFRRNPVIEQLAEQLIETRRQETEHLNRLFLLRLTNPWSSIKNSEVLFTDHAWAQVHHDFSSHHHHPTPPSARPRTAPNKRVFSRPQTAPAAAPTRRDKYFEKLATPRPKHFNDPLPPEIPTPQTRPGPPDLARLEKLAQPRQIHPPYIAPIVYPGCTDEQRRKPVKVREMDPVVLARLTKPKMIVNPEDVEPLHVPRVVRSRMGQKLMKGVKSKLISTGGGGSNAGMGSATYVVGDMDGQRSQDSVDGEVGKGEVGVGRFTVGQRPGGRGNSNANSHHPSVVDPVRGGSNASPTLGLSKNEVVKSQVFIDMYDQGASYSHANLLNEEGGHSEFGIYSHQQPSIHQLEQQESILSIERPSIGVNMEIVLQRPSVNAMEAVSEQGVEPETHSEEAAAEIATEAETAQLSSLQDQILVPPHQLSQQGSIILTTDDQQENILMSSDPNVAITETPVFKSDSESKVGSSPRLSKKASMVDDDRAWDLRASTIQPDFGASTRASVSQGVREDMPSDALLRRSVSFTGSFSSILEEKEDGDVGGGAQVPSVAIDGDLGASISEWKPINSGLGAIEGHSANISVIGSTSQSEVGSIFDESEVGLETENGRTGDLDASTTAVDGSFEIVSDSDVPATHSIVASVEDFQEMPTSTAEMDSAPPQIEDEVPSKASIRSSVSSFIRPSSSKGSRASSIRESISKSIHESASRISGALRLSGSRKNLATVKKADSVRESFDQVDDGIMNTETNDIVHEDPFLAEEMPTANSNQLLQENEYIQDDYEEVGASEQPQYAEEFQDPSLGEQVEPIDEFGIIEDDTMADETLLARSQNSLQSGEIADPFSHSNRTPVSGSKDILSITAADATAEEQKAAIALQSTFRGFQTRKKLGKGKSLDHFTNPKEEQSVMLKNHKSNKSLRGSQDLIKSTEDEAATTVQAAFRGYQVRKSLGQLKASRDKLSQSSTEKLKSSSLGNLTKKAIEPVGTGSQDLLSLTAEGATKEEQKAATTVQAAFRGHKTRKSMGKKLGSKDALQKRSSVDEMGGSIPLSSNHKSNKSMRESQDLMRSTEEEAATTVQAAFRGYQVRKSLEQLKASKEKLNNETSSVKSGSSGKKGGKGLKGKSKATSQELLHHPQEHSKQHKSQEQISNEPKDIDWWEKNGYRGF